MYWNRVLQEYFKERQFIEYAKAPTKHSSDLRMFLVIMQLNTTDIDDRVERIMLKTPEEDPALLIKELNAVRKNVIRVFDLLFKYVHILEDLPQFKFNLIEISLNLAKQYRSIVITDYNQHQKESNIKESERYLKMAACLEGDLKGDDLEEFLTDEADMIDAEDFNLKYCL